MIQQPNNKERYLLYLWGGNPNYLNLAFSIKIHYIILSSLAIFLFTFFSGISLCYPPQKKKKKKSAIHCSAQLKPIYSFL